MKAILFFLIISFILVVLYIIYVKFIFVCSTTLNHPKFKIGVILLILIGLCIPIINLLTITILWAILIADTMYGDYILNPNLKHSRIFKFLNKEI